MNMEVRLPSLEEQERIIRLPFAIDNELRLLKRMSHGLERFAGSLFKSWFIDFGPVLAKAEGKKPFGMDDETAALFPDSFEDSELGEIPKGWRVCRLSDISSTQYGYTASAIEEPVGPHLLRVTDINKQDWIDWDSVPYCVAPDKDIAKYRLEVGDIVVARMADPGKSAIVDSPNNAVFASYLVKLKTHSLRLTYYIYGFLKSRTYQEYSEGAMSGSVQKNMNARVITGACLVLPPDDILDAYLKLVLPARQSIALNLQVSANLSRIRDALLPKLLSGEIRIPADQAKKMGSGKVGAQ
jgi:type I restriction enzyme S subunit